MSEYNAGAGLTYYTTSSKIGVRIEGKYYIAVPKNKTASTKFHKWDRNYKEKLQPKDEAKEELIKLITNNKIFDLIDDPVEAYSIFIKMGQEVTKDIFKNLPHSEYPPRPNESFELLKTWFNEIVEINKIKVLAKSIDTSTEVLKQFEIHEIEKQIKSTKAKFLNSELPITKRYSETEIVQNKAFLEWLHAKKGELEQDNNEEIEIISEEVQQRVAWLYAIGVVDDIKSQHNIQSNATVGRVLSKGMGCSWDSVRKALDRLEKESLLDKYNDYINNTCQQIKINRIK